MYNEFDKKTFFDEMGRKVIRPDDIPIETRPSVYALAQYGGGVIFHRCTHSGLLSLPGGRIEAGESIDECICREGLEETGCILRRRGEQPLMVLQRQFYWSPGNRYFMSLILIYAAEVIGRPAPDWQPAYPDEVSEVVLLPLADIRAMHITSCFIEVMARFLASHGLQLR